MNINHALRRAGVGLVAAGLFAGVGLLASCSRKPTAEKADLYGGQKTCPVTGKELASMGAPIVVFVKGTKLYVCCASCVQQVEKDTNNYVGKVPGGGVKVQQPESK